MDNFLSKSFFFGNAYRYLFKKITRNIVIDIENYQTNDFKP